MEILAKDWKPVVEGCVGCARVMDDKELGFERCNAYINPSYWWSGGRHCPLTAKEMVTAADVAKMAIEEGIITKQSGNFVYANQRVAGNVGAVTSLLKRNKSILAEVKRKLGMTDGDTDQGKVRVGQQKQKKGTIR